MKDNYKCTHHYPGGPSVGYISKPHKIQPETDKDCHYYNHNWFNPEEYPEFWEPVEKDYEILSYIGKSSKNILGVLDPFVLTSSIESNSKNLEIYSVKRLSDGEIFTIGDKIDGFGSKNIPIESFIMENNIIQVWAKLVHGMNGWSDLNQIKRSKEPIFTTEDGHDVFEKELLYTVGFTNKVDSADYYKIATMNIKYTNKPNDIDYKWFKSKEKAEIWIEENKPQFSKKDMMNFHNCSEVCFDLWYSKYKK